MTKAELVNEVKKKAGLKTKKEAEKVVNAVFDAIRDALKRKAVVNIGGFGSFKVRRTKKRSARNPRTGEVIEVPARNVPVFRPAKALKEAVKK
jgi:nucleoid DNA-binding protein